MGWVEGMGQVVGGYGNMGRRWASSGMGIMVGVGLGWSLGMAWGLE